MDPTDAAPAGRAPGALLAAERERQGLSRADIAQRLRMSPWQIEALETGDYERLPRGPFLRGFVRNYAKVLGTAADPLLNALSVDAPERSRPGIVVATQNIRFDPLGQRLSSPYLKATGIAVTLTVIGFAAMYWWLFVRPAPPAVAAGARKATVAEGPKPVLVEPARSTDVSPVPQSLPPEAMIPETAKAEPAPPGPAKAEPVKAESTKPSPPPKTEPPKAQAALAPPMAAPASATTPAATAASQPTDPASVVAAGGSVIRLKFRGSSWVEIKDGRGKVLLSRNNTSGSEAEVIGKGPFTVVVGNAPDVTMFLNDREFDLEPHTRVAVARFTVP